MADLDLHYAFEDDGVYAIHEGSVVATGDTAEEAKAEAERVLAEKAKQDAEDKTAKRIASATHVVSPNGLKGKIQSRHSSWDAGENVTVRFENGRIVTLPTSKLDPEAFVVEQQRVASGSPVAALKQAFAASFEYDKTSLEARIAVLKEIVADGRELLQEGVSYPDQVDIDETIVHAEAEQSELAQALEHLNQVDDEYQAPTIEVVEQAQMGNQKDGDWLNQTLTDIQNENADQDFVKTLDEGPTEFAAQLPDAQLADTGLALASAREFIAAKTAGLEGDEVEKYRETFVARVEEARRAQLSVRKAEARKEASVQEAPSGDGPAEGLFL
jgi:hypothetical protein